MTLRGGIRRQAKALVERLLRHEIKTIEPHTIVLVPPGHDADVWFSYDLQLQRFLAMYEIDLVLDVGANEGQFARRLRHGYRGEIVSFEPTSAAFSRLVEATDTDARWTAHNIALGSETGTVALHVAADTAFSSLLVSNAFAAQRFRRSATVAEERVAIRRLDDVLTSLLPNGTPRRIFLKLDTQGFDLEVFKGLGSYASQVALIQSEVSLVPIYDGMPHWTESVSRYEAAGFHVAGMFPVTRDDHGRVIEYDCLMVRTVDARRAPYADGGLK